MNDTIPTQDPTFAEISNGARGRRSNSVACAAHSRLTPCRWRVNTLIVARIISTSKRLT